ncbi:MAG: hypothetical protein NWF00_07390 [Candidatus Bathyarchaeota archaeon]|nr:hypothetical protein [Candidatus Bathyarchaeota archaeon]
MLTIDTLWTSYSENSMDIIQVDDGNYAFLGRYIGLNTTTYDKIWLAKFSLHATNFTPTQPLPSPSQTVQPSPTIPEVTFGVTVGALAILAIFLVVLKKRRVPCEMI